MLGDIERHLLNLRSSSLAFGAPSHAAQRIDGIGKRQTDRQAPAAERECPHKSLHRFPTHIENGQKHRHRSNGNSEFAQKSRRRDIRRAREHASRLADGLRGKRAQLRDKDQRARHRERKRRVLDHSAEIRRIHGEYRVKNRHSHQNRFLHAQPGGKLHSARKHPCRERALQNTIHGYTRVHAAQPVSQRIQPAHKQRVQNRLRVVQQNPTGCERAHVRGHGRDLARIHRTHHLLYLVVAVRMNHARPVQEQIRQHADKKRQRVLPPRASAGRVRQHLHPGQRQRKQRPVKRVRAHRRDANRYKIKDSAREGDVSVQKQPRNDMNPRHHQRAERAANTLRPALRAREQKKEHQHVHARINQRIRKKEVRQIRLQIRRHIRKRA